MQDQEQPKQNLPRHKDKIWGIVALLILVVSGIWFWSVIHSAPHAEWRNAYRPLPWKQDGIIVSEAEASWKSSAGDERLELRTRYYPSGCIKLKEATGEGVISVRFIDPNGNQIGDRINVNYKDGVFTDQNDYSITIKGNELTARLEDGYQSDDEYNVHRLQENEALWRMEFDCQPAGKERSYLGHISIIPHEH